MHGDDLELLFGYPLANKASIQNEEIPWTIKSNRTDDLDNLYSYRIIEYWTKFASTGNPNNIHLPQWPKYNNSPKLKRNNSENNKYLLFKNNKLIASSGYSVKNCYFWNYVLPDLLNTYGKIFKTKLY